MRTRQTKQITARLPEPTLRQVAELTELYGSKTKALIAAIERLHQDEIAGKDRTMNDVELTVTIPTEEDHYTIDEADQHLLPQLLDNQERKIAEWLDANYPGMPYEIERVPEKLSRNNRDRTHSVRAEQALERLNQYIEDNWFYWWPEAGSE